MSAAEIAGPGAAAAPARPAPVTTKPAYNRLANTRPD
jgi:hypothetical protein